MNCIKSYLAQHPYFTVSAPLILISVGLLLVMNWQIALVAGALVAAAMVACIAVCRWQKNQMQAHLVADIRTTLTDVVQNEMSALALYMAVVERKPERMGELMDIYASMREHIGSAIDNLSADSLQQWKDRYQM